MIELVPVSNDNEDFIGLVSLLDKELLSRYPDIQQDYDKYNNSADLDFAVVAYSDNIPVGCGGYKAYDKDTVEIKRMFVNPDSRGNKIAQVILNLLELQAKDLSYRFAILETGISQPEAIHLYGKVGYSVIDNYGQYEGNSNSICMKKELK